VKNKVIVILGPTATHKSEIAINLARKFPLEIISADSMQFYKGMDIGTDKVSREIRKEIPHHLVDIVSIEDEFSIAEFKKLSMEKIKEISNRGHFPLVVGGSGLYIRALTENFPVETLAPPNKKLREELSKMPVNEIRKLANKINPAQAAKIGENDRKRLIRVIEYFNVTQKRISEVPVKEVFFNFLKIGLTKERHTLYKSIDLRVERMFEEGLISEVEALRKNYSNWSKTALQAIGYKEALPYFEGRISLEEAKELIKRRTRQFAKRQITWFKKEKNVVWFNAEDLEKVKLEIEILVKGFLNED